MRLIAPIAIVSLVLLSACQQDRTPPATTAAPSAEATPAAAPTETGQSVMDYTCEGGHGVAIIDKGEVARVTLSDGSTIDLPRDADQTPPSYAGEALAFAVTSTGGMLDQDEVANFPCKAAF